MYQRLLRFTAIMLVMIVVITLGAPLTAAQAHPVAPTAPDVATLASLAEPVAPTTIDLMQTEELTSTSQPLAQDGFGAAIPGPVQQFAGDCVYGGVSMYDTSRTNRPRGWFGQYHGTADPAREDLSRAPRAVVFGEVPAPSMTWDDFFGVRGFAYAGTGQITTYGTFGEVTLLANNPVFFTCSSSINYNWRTSILPTETFSAKTIYDLNNQDFFTGQPRRFLGNDNWEAQWTGLYGFNADVFGGYGCKSFKVPGPGGGGTQRVCLPGLYTITMVVNDGGEVWIDGTAPAALSGWYSAWQDRMSPLLVSFFFSAPAYFNAKGYKFENHIRLNPGPDGIAGTDDDFIDFPFDATVDMLYYEKDGRARASLFIGRLVDRKNLSAVEGDPEVNVITGDDFIGIVAPIDSDAVVDQDMIDRLWERADITLPNDQLGKWQVDPDTLKVDAGSDQGQQDVVDEGQAETLTPLSADQIVSTVYLPLLSR